MRHGILEPERDNFLTLARRVVRSRRYVMVDGKVEREVELRIMEALFNEDIPDTRDIMLISLVDACGLFKRLLTREERAEVEERLDLIRNLDLLGRTVFKVIGEAGKPAERKREAWLPGAATPGLRARALTAQPRAERGGAYRRKRIRHGRRFGWISGRAVWQARTRLSSPSIFTCLHRSCRTRGQPAASAQGPGLLP